MPDDDKNTNIDCAPEPDSSAEGTGADKVSETASEAPSADLNVSADEASNSDDAPAEVDSAQTTPAVEDLLKLHSRIDDVSEQVAAGMAKIVRQIEKKDDLVAELHKELEEGRRRVDVRLLRPLFESIVRVIEDMDANLERIKGGKVFENSRLLDGYKLQLLIALEGSGLTADASRMPEEDEQFDARKHSLGCMIKDSSPEKSRKLARVTAPHYYYEGQVLIQEKVDVYHYSPAIKKDGKENSE